MKRFKRWFTRERILILVTALYTAAMVYTHNIVSYVIAGLYVLSLAIFVAK
jgi:hypothetical protein